MYIGGIDQYTKLMLHGDEATLVDSSLSPKSLTIVGNAQRSTAQKVFGAGSVYIPDRNGSYVQLADSDDWYLNGDFTIDGRIKWETANNNDYIVDQKQDSSNFMAIVVQSNSLHFFQYFGGVYKIYITCPFTPSTTVFQHFAIIRFGNQYYMSVGGTFQTVTLVDGSMSNALGNISAPLIVGTNATDSGYGIQGWIDEFRWSKGIARWTSNFALPSQAYSTQAYYARKIVISD